MSVSVVIPVFNQVALTERCLASVLLNSDEVKEVIVINNASTDATVQCLEVIAASFEAKKIYFQVIHNPVNQGFGKACNQGIRLAKFECIAIVNNDTWLMPHWDSVLKAELLRLSLNCIGPYFYEKPFQDETITEIAAKFVSKNHRRVRHHFVPILMFFSRTSIEQLKLEHGGVFDERFFVTYEDTDLKERMKQLQMRWAQTGSCFIWHHSMATRSSLPNGYEQEGLRLFTEKWGFDPRRADHTVVAKLRRRYWKWKESRGLF